MWALQTRGEPLQEDEDRVGPGPAPFRISKILGISSTTLQNEMEKQ